MKRRRVFIGSFLATVATAEAAEFKAAQLFFRLIFDPARQKLAKRPAFSVDEAVDRHNKAGKQHKQSNQSQDSWKDVHYVVGAHLGAVF